MAVVKKSKQRTEFGDWQTPINLARDVCSLLSRKGLRPASILEPTCGHGAFLVAALESFPTVKEAVGIDINDDYIKIAEASIRKINTACNSRIMQEDFFSVDWDQVVSSLPEPILIIGNPPWVTNAQLTSFGSSNLPPKSNFQNHRGIEAITGKSNFDISEWMLIQVLDWIQNRKATLAMLCKSTVARKILAYAWQSNYCIKTSKIYNIEAQKHFEASVDACLLVISVSSSSRNTVCMVYDSLNHKSPSTTIGYQQCRLVANVKTFERYKHLVSRGKQRCNWRSGIKHDCSRIMEFRKEQRLYRNGLGELVDLEDTFLYPMLKSSDLAKGPPFNSLKRMLVTQRIVGESTSRIKDIAPKTWKYLNEHAELLSRRASSIYRNRPRFSIFGVGDYSFAPWKVGISGFYKHLNFRIVGSVEEKPVMLDDTCYFVACKNEDEAIHLEELLNSEVAKDFFSCFIFWDAKRPITTNLLGSLDINALAKELGRPAWQTEEVHKQGQFVFST